MFDIVYYIGVMCIEFIQELYEGSEAFVSWTNDWADPHLTYTYIFPAIAMLDSVFASQYLLVMAGGEWINVILKWLLMEHRPYWWVQETDYYGEGTRPALLQTGQTCETGPGSPSGHVMSAAEHAVLLCMWIAHVAADRKWRIGDWLWWMIWLFLAAVLCQVGAARMAIATHFPHQVLLGALTGFLVAPMLTILVSDPYVWSGRGGRRRHVLTALGCAALGGAIYWLLKLVGVDPQWSVRLAFKWCQRPENIQVTTTPLFALTEACAGLLSWAVFVSPAVARYRYNSKNRSLVISICLVAAIHYASSLWQESIPTDKAVPFYVHQFVYAFVQGGLYLRLVPFLSMLPWRVSARDKKK